MSCRRELKKVQLAAAPPPEPDDLKPGWHTDLLFRAGYSLGYHDALREAIQIVEEEHEEEEEA